MEKLPLDNFKKKNMKKISLNNIKSSYIIKRVFSFLYENMKYEILKHNKKYQNFFYLNIDSYKKLNGRYKKNGINGHGQEFLIESNDLVFEGEYLNGKRNGKGKEYFYYCGPLEFNYKPHYSDGPSNTNDRYGYFHIYTFNSFEGEYKNGKRNGKGKEFYSNKK